MCLRIQRRRATVKALQRCLQHAYPCDDVRLRRRTTVLIDLLVHHVPVAVLSERWGRSPACLYGWPQALRLPGLDSLGARHGGGRRPQLPPQQKKRLVELSEAGPQVVALETACWHSVCIRGLSWREFGGLYHRPDVCPLLHHLGLSWQQARFVADQREAAMRLAWLEQQWPTIVRAATRRPGLRLFADEASCAPWGSLSYLWARRGRQPEGPTSGQRKGYQGFGAMAYCSGGLCSQGIEGRFHADSSQAC